MQRKTLPPFARAIVAARNLGQHPERIVVLLGRDWCHREIAEHLPGLVMVLARDVERGTYANFAWCAGVPVVILNQDAPIATCARLVVDVARFAAPVYVYEDPFEEAEDAELYLWARSTHPRRGASDFPNGWDDAAVRSYVSRAGVWRARHAA